jgi:hypothetical protein
MTIPFFFFFSYLLSLLLDSDMLVNESNDKD